MAESEHDDKDKRSPEARLDLVERDLRSHARSLTEIVKAAGKGFTPEQVEQMRSVFREELSNAGLRLDEPDQVDQAREDFRFLRRWRLAWDSAAKRVGNSVLVAIVALFLVIFGAGFWAWISTKGGGH
jgi:hypothetical protein